MKKAMLSLMGTGHWLATFKSGNVVTGTRVVGSASDSIENAARHLYDNFDVGLVLYRHNDKILPIAKDIQKSS